MQSIFKKDLIFKRYKLIYFLILIVFSSCNMQTPEGFQEDFQTPSSEVSEILVDSDLVYIDVGETKSVNVSVRPLEAEVPSGYSYTSNKTISLSFDDEVEGKLNITGMNEGTNTITFKMNEIKATVDVIVGDYDSWFTFPSFGSVSRSEKFPYATVNILQIKNLIDGKEVKKIHADAFHSTSSYMMVRTLIIDEGIEEIGSNAFCCIIGLKSVSLPDSLRIIGPSAFSMTWGLEKIFFPDGVTIISDRVFQSSGLKEFIVKDTVTTIGERAFANCNDLEKLVIPSSVYSIGTEAFINCRKAEIYIEAEKDSITGYPWGHPYPSMIHWSTK